MRAGIPLHKGNRISASATITLSKTRHAFNPEGVACILAGNAPPAEAEPLHGIRRRYIKCGEILKFAFTAAATVWYNCCREVRYRKATPVMRTAASMPANTALYSELESREALDIYATHPAHMEVKKFVHSVICERANCDYEV